MSSIRLFILSSFAKHGPMHGHRVRVEAERSHIALSTDITVGAVYGAIKRLALEGLLTEKLQEREGNRPMRQVYEISPSGRTELHRLRLEALKEIDFRKDPFDLALIEAADEASADSEAHLKELLLQRRNRVRERLTEAMVQHEKVKPEISLAQSWALKHTEYRLEAELAYLTDLIASVNTIFDADRQAKAGTATLL